MNKSRVDALMAGHDATLEVSDELLQSAIANGFKCTADIEDIRDCNFYIVAVPTPVDHNHNPDLTPLYSASTTVGKVISKGDIVVYESTVYPGVTEDECIPVVEKYPVWNSIRISLQVIPPNASIRVTSYTQSRR